MAGFSQGGGVGLALANWMVEGDPGFDVWGMDVARYGDWTTLAYTNAKVRENYSRRFRIRFPNEELPAARPLRTTPIYDRLDAEGAPCSATIAALEHPLWFAPLEGARLRGCHLPALRRARLCRRPNAGRARRRRPDRDYRLRQVRGHRPGRGGVPGAGHGQPDAGGRPHGADPHAERARQADRRLHGGAPGDRPVLRRRHLRGRDLLPALVRAVPARRRRARCGPAPSEYAGLVGRRAASRATCCRRWWRRICRPRPSRS